MNIRSGNTRTTIDIHYSCDDYIRNMIYSKNSKNIGGRMVYCCKCYDSQSTLRKLPDGRRICEKCLKNIENE